MKGKYNVLDMFAGCGGLSYGFKSAGFNIVVASEINETSAKTYKKNHKKTNVVVGDITLNKVKMDILKNFENIDCDVLFGGPPCQAYSMAGLRRPDDPRANLFEEYVDVVKKLKPKIFVMENVVGMLSIKTERENLSKEEKQKMNEFNELLIERANLTLKKRSKTRFTPKDERKLKQVRIEIKTKEKETDFLQEKLVDKMIRKFRKIGYNNIEYKVLNSADFGVPQLRKRVIFIGTKYDLPIQFPKETHKNKWMTVKEAIDDLKNKKENIELNHIMTKHSEKFLEKIRKTQIGKNVCGTHFHAYDRPDPTKPSDTVKENHGSVFIHYEKNRVMTPRELARLQSFPDSFIFEGSKKSILVQIGNAVPCNLSKAIAKSVKNMLKQINNQTPQSF